MSFAKLSQENRGRSFGDRTNGQQTVQSTLHSAQSRQSSPGLSCLLGVVGKRIRRQRCCLLVRYRHVSTAQPSVVSHVACSTKGKARGCGSGAAKSEGTAPPACNRWIPSYGEALETGASERRHHWRNIPFPPVTARPLRGARSLKGSPRARPLPASYQVVS